jgi:hypothetical protein
MTFTYDTTMLLDFQKAFDLCVLNDRAYVSGYGLPRKDLKTIEGGEQNVFDVKSFMGPIITIDLNSHTQTNTFGYKIPSFSGIGVTSGMLSETFLDCNSTTQTVVGQLRYFPYVFGYDLGGAEKWVSKIEGMISTKVKEFEESDGRPGVYFNANEDFYHWLLKFSDIYESKFSLINIVYALPQPAFAKSDDIKIDMDKVFNILIDTGTGAMTRLEDGINIETIRGGMTISREFNDEKHEYSFYIHE